MAAGSLTALPEWRGQEGPRFRITLGPACITIGHKDLARAERTAERAERRARMDAHDTGSYWAENVGDRADADPRAPITGWSRRSRARLFHATGELDYAPMVVDRKGPVMSTLTYPKKWLVVAPTGAAAKKHLEVFYVRFERAWGVPFVGLWKQEFQARGAVHFHLWHPRPGGLAGTARRFEYEARLAAWKAAKEAGEKGLRRPYWRDAVGDGLPYEQWLSLVWADIVDHPDPGERAKHLAHGAFVSEVEEGHVNTPAKLAAYFAKHGAFMAKDYQNKVPPEWRKPGAGPGRFWGYKGLKREVRVVDVAPADADRAARILRRLSARERYWDPTYVDADGKVVGKYRWKKAVREARVERGVRVVDRETGECKGRYRKVMRPAVKFASGSGFLCLDDAPTTLVQLARALDIWREYQPPTARQEQARERAVKRRTAELAATGRAAAS